MLQLLILSGLLLLLAVKGDGHFPLPEGTPEASFQVYCLGLTAVFGWGLVTLVRRAEPESNRVPVRLAAAIAGSFLVADLAVLWLEARRFATFGYSWRPLPAILITLGPAAALWLLALRQKGEHSTVLLFIAALSHAALMAYACACFPLAAGRSDMVPLLLRSSGELLAGRNPYSFYHLAPGIDTYLTYLPGLLLAYSPAHLIGCDPRLLGALYTLAAVALLFRYYGASAAVFLSVFIVNPYLIYRHDSYLPPFWLLLALAAVVPLSSRIAPIVAAILAATSQLLVVPAIGAVIGGARAAKRFGMARRILVFGAASVLLVAPFVALAPVSFLSGTVGHWMEARNLKSLGASYWLLRVVSEPLLHLLQAVMVIAGLASAWRHLEPTSPGIAQVTTDRISAARVFGASALALFAFCALNTVIWTYFYMVVLFLAILACLNRARSTEEHGRVIGASAAVISKSAVEDPT